MRYDEPYTNLVRLKMAMNDGRMPPMTPLSEMAKELLDPSFTPGMGALEEHEERGLRCPVKECGEYFHRLDIHLRSTHKAIGGAAAVRAALDIPRGVNFISRVESARLGERARSLPRPPRPFVKGDSRLRRASSRKHGGAAGVQQSAAVRNMKDSCDAQLTHRIIDLANRLGRSPSGTEFEAEYGATIVSRVRAAFGTWSNAKAHCSLKVYRQGRRQMTAADVLPGIEAWYLAHGDLPGSADAVKRRTPLLPAYQTILHALKAKTWPQAMEYAASFLNIYGGRYGLPEHLRPKESAA